MSKLFDNGDEAFEKGKKYIEAGDFDNAIDALSKSIIKNPRRPKIHGMRGFAYFNRGDEEKGDFRNAIDDFDKSLEEEKSPFLYNMRGIAHVINEDFDEAINDLSRALPDFKTEGTYFWLGVAYLEQGDDFQWAAHCFLEAIEINPRNPTHYLQLAITKLEQGDERNAATAYKKAISINPELIEHERSSGSNKNMLWREFKARFRKGLIRTYD